MSMALTGGSAGTATTSIASSSQSFNNSGPSNLTVTPVQSTFQQRTQGSVFSDTSKFGDLTFRNANRQQQARANNSSASSLPVGNLLAGNFGSLTASRMNAGSMGQSVERNRDQDMTKTSDEMMEIANNLTMKDMWAAA